LAPHYWGLAWFAVGNSRPFKFRLACSQEAEPTDQIYSGNKSGKLRRGYLEEAAASISPTSG
jgi:hypothetical protein